MAQFNELPLWLQERMLQRQVEAGNKRDASVFEKKFSACTGSSGFDWSSTPEGQGWWFQMLDNKIYKHFPTPLTYEPIEERLMEVSDYKDFKDSQKRVVFGRKNGFFLAWSGVESLDSAKKAVTITEWNYSREVEEVKEVVLTMEEIAKLANCSVEQLKIKK